MFHTDVKKVYPYETFPNIVIAFTKKYDIIIEIKEKLYEKIIVCIFIFGFG